MSDVTLHGVLNMPPELWKGEWEIEKLQRHARYVEASNKILELQADNEALKDKLNEWISAEDRLPENHKPVLCYGFSGENDNDPYQKDYDLGALNPEGCTIVMYGLCNGHVTHWMPLPEPPKEINK